MRGYDEEIYSKFIFILSQLSQVNPTKKLGQDLDACLAKPRSLCKRVREANAIYPSHALKKCLFVLYLKSLF